VNVHHAVPEEPVVRLLRLLASLGAECDVEPLRRSSGGRGTGIGVGEVEGAGVEQLAHLADLVLVGRRILQRDEGGLRYPEDLDVADLAHGHAAGDQDQEQHGALAGVQLEGPEAAVGVAHLGVLLPDHIRLLLCEQGHRVGLEQDAVALVAVLQ